MPLHRHLPGLIAALSLLGCQSGATDEDLRQAWLVEALTDDNRVWFSRPAIGLQTKYRRMADDPYDFLRGTGGVAFRDWSRTTPGRSETAFIEAAGADAILLVGDPHPENLGTYLPGDAVEPTSRLAPIVLHIEPNDFDGAGFGPWTLDVRRAAQGLAVLLEQAHCDEDCRLVALSTLAGGYAAEIAAQEAGEPTWHPGLTGAGDGLIDQLVFESIEEGLHRERLLAWTRPTTTGLSMRFDPELDEDGRGTLPLTAEEHAQLDRLLAAYAPHAPDGFRVFDAGRRFGTGVASIPSVRYVVAFDRGDPGEADDALLQLREVVDPPRIPGLLEDPSMLWDSNADRVDGAAKALWHHPETDPLAAGLTDGAMTFKAVTGSSFAEALAHDDVVDTLIFAPDRERRIAVFADRLGRILAATHGRSHTWSGDPALPVIADDLRSRGVPFASEVARTGERDRAILRVDHQLFVAALDELGPLLGAERMGVR